mmetsp:Transcript_36949/g.61258  ORF Transcript_36949/g.61258 Transcript_36949/m.61258 type:complete len:189 (+) Transcript_36949:60-626(+)
MLPKINRDSMVRQVSPSAPSPRAPNTRRNRCSAVSTLSSTVYREEPQSTWHVRANEFMKRRIEIEHQHFSDFPIRAARKHVPMKLPSIQCSIQQDLVGSSAPSKASGSEPAGYAETLTRTLARGFKVYSCDDENTASKLRATWQAPLSPASSLFAAIESHHFDRVQSGRLSTPSPMAVHSSRRSSDGF